MSSVLVSSETTWAVRPFRFGESRRLQFGVGHRIQTWDSRKISSEQGANMEIGAATFEHKVYSTSRQPDNSSCGVCVLIEIQRITDGNIDSQRDPCSDAAELLRYLAKWTCEILTNPAPTSSRGTGAAVRGRAAKTTAGICDVEMDEAQPPGARKRVRAPLDNPRGTTKQKRRPTPSDRKREGNLSQGDEKNAGRRKHQPAYRGPQGAKTDTSTPAGTADTPP